MENPITWAMLVALIGIVVWVSRVSLAFGRLESSATEARRVADAAKEAAGGATFAAKEEARRIADAVKKETEGFSMGLAALTAAFNLFQVQIAERYITRDILKEFEERLIESRRETTDAIRADIKELRTRIEQLSRPNGRRTK
jgi:hypothetical protein